VGRLIKFEKMITPIIIQIIFWIGFIGSIFAGLGLIAYGFISSSAGMLEVFTGFISLLLGPLIIRIYCEMLMVVFSMQRALIDIRDSVEVVNHKPIEPEQDVI